MSKKEEFLNLGKITVKYDLAEYWNAEFQFVECSKKISELTELYHPWFGLDGALISFEDALLTDSGSHEMGLRLPDIIVVDSSPHRKEHIENIEFGKLWAVPVATDLGSGISLILDSNHTLSYLYRKYLDEGIETIVPVMELRGHHLEDVFYDFKILNKKKELSII